MCTRYKTWAARYVCNVFLCVFSSDREERGGRGARGLGQPLLVGAEAAGAGERARPAARRGARRQVSCWGRPPRHR